MPDITVEPSGGVMGLIHKGIFFVVVLLLLLLLFLVVSLAKYR